MNKYVGKVNLSELTVHDGYQRILGKKVNEIVKNFDDTQVRYLDVSIRDGKKYVVNGQHTAEALRRVYGKDYMADAFIYEGLTYEEEAELFIKLNTNSKKTTYNDNLKASIAAKDTDAVLYKQMLDDSGIKYNFTNGNSGKTFTAHKTSFVCFKKYGKESCIRAFKIIENTDEADFYNGKIFNGLVAALSSASNINDVDMKRTLIRNGYDKIFALATTYGRCATSGYGGINWAKAIADLYNKGRRTGKIKI